MEERGRGPGRGGAFLLVSPLLGPPPTRSSRGEEGELDAALAVPSTRRASLDFDAMKPLFEVRGKVSPPVLQSACQPVALPKRAAREIEVRPRQMLPLVGGASSTSPHLRLSC